MSDLGKIKHCRMTINKVKSHCNWPRRLKGELEVWPYSFYDLGARWGWVVNATPRPLYPRERPGTHCVRGWLGPKAGLDGFGKTRPKRESIPA
jgi:hypothetical protein